MGGRSSSSSSSSNSTKYETTDNRGYVETGGVGVSGSSGVTIETVDADVLGVALDFARDVGNEAIETLNQTTDESLGILREAKEDNAKEIAMSVTKWLLGGVSAVALAYVMMRKR